MLGRACFSRCRRSAYIASARSDRRPICSTSTLGRGQVTVAIRAEDPKRVWERRAPLTPKHVEKLVGDGCKVLVQPSAKRVFHDRDYVEVSACFSACGDVADAQL